MTHTAHRLLAGACREQGRRVHRPGHGPFASAPLSTDGLDAMPACKRFDKPGKSVGNSEGKEYGHLTWEYIFDLFYTNTDKVRMNSMWVKYPLLKTCCFAFLSPCDWQAGLTPYPYLTIATSDNITPMQANRDKIASSFIIVHSCNILSPVDKLPNIPTVFHVEHTGTILVRI